MVWRGAGGRAGSTSMGTGEPSLERLSGVWTPLEWADSAPVWLGEAGALLKQQKKLMLMSLMRTEIAQANTEVFHFYCHQQSTV